MGDKVSGQIKKLKNVTLVGVDCVNIERLINVVNICQQDMRFKEVKILSSIPSENKNVILIPKIRNLSQYSHFIIKKLNNYIDTAYVLIIQYDGFILNPSAWRDEFLNYDYIGARWGYNDGMDVGNGGFSLRSKRLLNIVQNGIQIKGTDSEDTSICRTNRLHLEKKGVRFAPQDVAEKFSIEGMSKKRHPNAINIWNGQFGFHSLTRTDISLWLKKHQEVSIKNNLEKEYSR